MTLWVLDTAHVSLFQRRHPAVVEQLRLRKDSEFATTIVTYEEQMQGWLAVIRRSPTPETLIRDYGKLASARRFFEEMQVLDFTAAAAVVYAELLGQKLRVGTQDLRIAAIVLSIEAVLVTRNRQDFERVSGLQIEDWSSG